MVLVIRKRSRIAGSRALGVRSEWRILSFRVWSFGFLELWDNFDGDYENGGQ